MAPRMAAVLRAPGKLCSFSYVLLVFLLFYVLDVVRFKVQGSLLFVTYTIIQGIIGSEMLIRTGPLNGKCKKKYK